MCAETTSQLEIAKELCGLGPDLVRQVVRFMAPLHEQFDLTPAQSFLLTHLYQHGPATASTIAEWMGITSGPVTNLTARFVRRGWIERRPDEADKRISWFTLTESGRLLAQRFIAANEELWRRVIAAMDARLVAQAVPLLKDLSTVLAGLTDTAVS
ncbi:MarR family winged helix-turn-helix transcriptional regulator [Alicyclobacillus shizuokensis]|uniref:MarR family winged helix-turn-helix transcriptional regulator n=1 Tax=Alicyclobacillus shizuokensis TaxID=392014 RepID=UPI000835A168|nr:MarR family transcriptional regulator [Alicyclobacillus shizuokensis]MCL6627710.1 MarR family transcriptional regulator [Alicyclobacillus shizuokensis]